MLTLGGAHTYGGGTSVTAGTLTLAGSLNLGSSSAALSVASGATLNGSGVVTAGTLALSGGGSVNLGGANAFASLSGTGTLGSVTLNDTAALSIGALSTAGGLNVTSAGAITLSGAVSDSSASGITLSTSSTSASALTLSTALSATGSGAITLNAGGSIVGASSITTQGGLINLDANSANSGSGAIVLTGATLTSNGGAIVLSGGGGSLAAQIASGAASGTASQAAGVTLSGATTISAGAGAITIRGRGYAAGTSTGYHGVAITGGGVTSTSGAITVTGVGGGTGAAGTSAGVYLGAANAIATTAGGLVTISGAGGSGTGGANYGITMTSGSSISGASPVLSATTGFYNGAGASAVTATSGRWLIYSPSPSADYFNGLNSGNTAVWNATYASSPPGSLTQTGNRYVFAYQPTVTFASVNDSKTYGVNASAAVAADYTVGGLQSGVAGAFLGDTNASAFSGAPTVTSAGSATSATVAGGPYAINVSLASVTGLNGYAVAQNSTGVLTVNKAALTITGGTTSTTYNGAAQSNAYAITAGQLYGTDTLTGVAGLASGTNAGTYADSLSGATGTGLGNYAISYVNGSLTIGKAALTLTGASRSVTYDGTVQTNAAATLTGLQGSDSFTVTGLASGAHAGTYADSLGLVANGGTLASNYTLAVNNGSLTIAKAALTLTGVTTSTTYNGGAQSNAYAITAGQLYGTDTLTGVTGLASGTNAGTYADSLSGATGTGLGNYTISYVNGSLAIAKAALTITGASRSVTYDGTAQTNAAATLTGLQGSDGFTITGLASGTHAGTYADSLALVANGGTLASNYSLAVSNGSLTIDKAALTITGGTTSTTYNGGAQANIYAITAGQLYGTDSLTGVTGLASGTNAGTYADSLSGATGTGLGNYAISYVNGSLTIAKAPLTLTYTPQAASSTYGGPLAALGGTVTGQGFVGGEGLSDLSGRVEWSTSARPGSSAGVYAVLGGGLSSDNYALTDVQGPGSARAYTIEPAPLTITPSDMAVVYSGVPFSGGTGVAMRGLVNGDTPDSFAGALTYGGSAQGATGVGSYSLTASGLTNPNYAIAWEPGTLDIMMPQAPKSDIVTASIAYTLALHSQAGTDAPGPTLSEGDASAHCPQTERSLCRP